MAGAQSPTFRLQGIGIDLLSLSRARRLIRSHNRRIRESLLTPGEQKDFLGKQLPAVEFAKKFTAKEAFFKALGISWMGVEGFGQIEVKSLPNSQFRVK